MWHRSRITDGKTLDSSRSKSMDDSLMRSSYFTCNVNLTQPRNTANRNRFHLLNNGGHVDTILPRQLSAPLCTPARPLLQWRRRTVKRWLPYSTQPVALIGKIPKTGTPMPISRDGTESKPMPKAAWWRCLCATTTSKVFQGLVREGVLLSCDVLGLPQDS